MRAALAAANPGATILFDDSLSGLTITLAGELAIAKNLTIDGGGVVTPTVGAHVYVSGTLVTLSVTPHPGSRFAGWSGDGCAAGQVTLDADRVCTATFVLEEERYLIHLPLVARNLP
ncbi:MAG: hypothetical protein JXA21_19300 [Anaerolineae bacterium]|nr:hypothetical protein [Anaerolineae bacterium]